MPIGQSFETRSSVRSESLFRRPEDLKKMQQLPMGEEENATCQKKERVRHCAICPSDACQCRGTVRPPSEIARRGGGGRKVPKEDVKGHESLCSDMGWGIRSR